MKLQRLLITGATGAIGRSLLGYLEPSSWEEVRLLIHRAEPPAGSWSIVRGDLEAQRPLDQALSGIDVVLHLAGRGHAHSEEDYRRLNVEGTRALLVAAERAGVGRFVFVSSRAAGPTGGAYASSKLAAEEMVEKSPLPWSILCPSEVYGAGAGGFVNHLVGWVWKWHLVPMPGDGSDKVAPVHLEDLAPAMASALTVEEALGRRFVMAGPDIVTVLELIDRAGRLAHRRPLVLPLPWWLMRGAARLARWAGSLALVEDQIDRLRSEKETDSASAIAILGFKPRGLDEGLREMARLPNGMVFH